MTMRRVLEGSILACCLPAVLACQAEDAAVTAGRSAAVTNGIDDDGDPGVVGLTTFGAVFCTGTIIDPRVVLTAAHCARAAGLGVFFGSGPDVGTSTVAVIERRIHPDYEPIELRNDIALLLLEYPAAAPAVPSPLARVDDDTLLGVDVRVVGFGQRAGGLNEPPRKRQGTALIGRVVAASLALVPGPAQPCFGDSGGPVFARIGGAEYLVGVTSHGDAHCQAEASAVRVSAYLSEFVEPYLDRVRPMSAQPGQRCLYPEHCAGAECRTPADDGFSYCAEPCGTDGDCGPEMVCDRGGCEFDGPSPGARGAPCADDEDCAASTCSEDRRGQLVCAAPCLPGVLGCENGSGCEHVPGRPDRYACVAREPAGCAVARGALADSGSPTGRLLLIALVLVALRRRRARPGDHRR